MGKALRVYLDTNVLMEFRDIREHAWEKFLGVESVILVIAQVLFEELQKLKDKPGLPRKKRQRAGDLIVRLERALFPSDKSPLTVPLRDHVALAYDGQSPPAEIFAQHFLDSAQPDDRLVAAAISAERSGSAVWLVSGDAGPRMLARGIGLHVREPLEDWRRPIEPDEVEVENRELKRQLAAYQAAAPKLDLQLQIGGNVLRYTLPKPRVDDVEEYTQRYVEMLRGTHDLVENTTPRAMIAALGGGPGPGEMARYTEELERFFSEVALTIPKAIRHQNWLDLYIPINLSITNSGSKPAESVRIDLEFPPLHSPQTTFPLKERPTLPARPRPPLSMMETIMAVPDFSRSGLLSTSALGMVDWDLNKVDWQIDGTSVSVEVGGIRHTDTENLPQLFVRLPEDFEANGFAIEYQVHAHNLPKPEEGEIHIKVERGSQYTKLQLERDPDPEPEED